VTGWLVAGIVALGLLVLVLALMALGRRARPFQRATRRLRLRTEQAEQLRQKVAVVQEQVLSLQEGAAVMQERLEARQH
jgi:hypothetical protein